MVDIEAPVKSAICNDFFYICCQLPRIRSRASSPFSLAMSTPKLGEIQALSQEEQVLHHYAAMVKKDLERYHKSTPGEKQRLGDMFKEHLVFH
jgi:hypothetical protein